MSIDDAFWDNFDLLPLTPEARADLDAFNEALDAAGFDDAWGRAILRRGGQL